MQRDREMFGDSAVCEPGADEKLVSRFRISRCAIRPATRSAPAAQPARGRSDLRLGLGSAVRKSMCHEVTRIDLSPESIRAALDEGRIDVAIGPIRGVLPTRRFLPALTKRSRPARRRAIHLPRRKIEALPPDRPQARRVLRCPEAL